MEGLAPGTVFLQRPIYQLWWCIQRATWPHFISIGHAIVSLVIIALQLPFCGWKLSVASASHSVLYMGNGEFTHTTLGKVVLWTRKDFPPGYLETALVLEPRDPRSWKPENVESTKASWVGRRVSIIGFIFTIHFACPWALGAALEHYYWMAADERLHNCTELTAALWHQIGNVTLWDPLKLHRKGIMPWRYTQMREFRLKSL